MAKRSPLSSDPQLLLAELRLLLDNFDRFLSDEEDVRARVRQFIPLSGHLRHVGLDLRP